MNALNNLNTVINTINSDLIQTYFEIPDRRSTLLADFENSNYAAHVLTSNRNDVESYASMVDCNNNNEVKPCSLFGVCKICGDDTATGVHYGVASCEGCKGFYKRTRARKEKYRCNFGMSCPITPETRNYCKACRFEKCKRVGMSMENIKLGRIPRTEKLMLEINCAKAALSKQVNKQRSAQSYQTADQLIINTFFKNIFQSKNESVSITQSNTSSTPSSVCRSDEANSSNTCYIHDETEEVNLIVQYARPPSPVTTLLKALNNDESTVNLFSTKMHAIYMHHSNRIITSLHEANASISINRMFDDQNIAHKYIWAGLLLSINTEVSSLIAFLKDIPGLDDLYICDFPFVMNDLLFEYFLMMNAPLYINGECFYILPNGVRYSRQRSSDLFGDENTSAKFEFTGNYNALRLTCKEKALIFPFVFTMNYYKFPNQEKLRNVHEYYMKAFVSEMVKNQRDSEFIANLKQTIAMLPLINEQEKQSLRKTKPILD